MVISLKRFVNRANAGREMTPWTREVEERIQAVELDAARRAESDLNTNKAQSSSMARLASTVAAMPIPGISVTSATGFSLTAGGTIQVASTPLTVPAGKSLATYLLVGSAAAVDLTSGGLTTCFMSMSMESLFTQEFAAAKDAGASAVNNVMNGSGGGSIPVTAGATIVARIYLRPLNAAAFGTSAGNYANLSVLALFT